MSGETPQQSTGGALIQLRAAGVGVVVDLTGPGVPSLLHWGTDLGDRLAEPEMWAPALATSAPDVRIPLTLLAGSVGGTPHLPALRGAPAWAPRWLLHSVAHEPGSVRTTCRAEGPGLVLVTELVLDDHGVLRVAHTLTN